MLRQERLIGRDHGLAFSKRKFHQRLRVVGPAHEFHDHIDVWIARDREHVPVDGYGARIEARFISPEPEGRQLKGTGCAPSQDIALFPEEPNDGLADRAQTANANAEGLIHEQV